LVEALCYNPKVVCSIGSLRFFRPRYAPGVDSASNRNEYEKFLLGVKADGVCS
jgi:hypothetical protein